MTIINNALTGALAAQIVLDTTSQNIANVMTPGYTRQGVLLGAAHNNRGAIASPGDGVKVSSLLRFSDGYKNLQMWLAGSELGQRSATQPYLTQLEQVMGDDSASINNGLDGFFGALNAASVEPTSSPLRQQVVTAADALAQRFNSLRQVLSVQRISTQQQRTAAVSQINEISRDIAILNDKIVSSTTTGASPSGLVDERDRKIDALASLVGVQVIDQPDGSRTVTLRSGQPLVVGKTAATVTVQSTLTGAQTLQLVFAHETFTLGTSGLGGQLGGLDEFENNILAPLTQSIVDMASGLAAQVNTQLGAGFTMAGTPGGALFQFDPASTSALLKVPAGFTGQDLGFSANAAQPGNSDNLLAVIDLKNQPVTVTSLGAVLLGDVYTQLTGKLAMDSQQNQDSLKIAQTVRDQAEANWKTTSGVNSDEEAMNLMQYQQMYQANMKVIAVANQLLDSTLAMFN
ncbi:MAG: flgK [Rhodocyclaceae bacterium]|nr:flgK [Rhodocyclaceae bacterium]